MPHKILVLGGTRDARAICDALHDLGHGVTLSLAGVTENPETVKCKVRVGGFGGAEGLRNYLQRENISVLIDATHPFAAQISANAAKAVEHLAITHLRLTRPAWAKPKGAIWIKAKSYEESARLLPPNARVFLAIGRKELAPFLSREDISGILRMIELPAQIIPGRWILVRARPPTSVEPELELMKHHRITYLVSKNAGGPASHKLDAAAQLGIPAIMIARPAKRGGKVFGSVGEVIHELA